MANKEATKVDLKAKVEVVATDKHPFYKKGDKFQCGIVTKQTLLDKGFIAGDKEAAKTEKEATKA